MKIKTKAQIAPEKAPQPGQDGPVMKNCKNRNAVCIHRVRFHVIADEGAQVYVAGSFNQWNPRQKRMTDPTGTGDYQVCLCLPCGDHEYKFVIDGTWCVDPQCPDWTLNDQGTLNSVVHVR